MTKLILLRHGQSAWNEKNLFTGWVDISLSQQGVYESSEAGLIIAQYPIDMIFSSSLIRTTMTALLVMALHPSGKVPVILHPGEGRMEEWAHIESEKTKNDCIPLIQAWQFNERMYGQLQGFNKEETAEKYGDAQVKTWRRGYDVAPPQGESLEMTAQRSIPYFEEVVMPYLSDGKNVFICAHGNSLRAIIMYLEKLTKEQVVSLELQTGKPRVYHFDNKQFTLERNSER